MGCLGCPMGNRRLQEAQFQEWPHIKKYYLSAFDEMLKRRQEKGLGNNSNWNCADDVMLWWLGYNKKSNPDQMTIEDLENL